MEIGVIKNDVVTELRTTLYYNEIEIARVAQKNDLNHKERIDQIVALTRENANVLEALKLVEAYFTAKQQPVPPAQPTSQEPTV